VTILGASPVCVLLPAYNEANRIGATVHALRSRRAVDTIIVVDDGSTDDTTARAREAGADVVLTQQNGGKGSALTAAFRAAPAEAEIFLLLDSDLGPSAAECVKLLPPLWNNSAEMTIGTLPPDPEFAASGRRGGAGLVVRLARWGIARRTGQVFRQPLSGQRAVRRAVLEAVNGKFAPGFGVEVGLTVAALTHGFRVVEVETEFRHHVTGSDWRGLCHRARQWRDVARVVWKQPARGSD
jgi:glucosyl-3-phosphoglycerate synthase